MNQIRFSCTSLVGTNKVGTLPKDENGYYTVVLGALNCYNSAGQYYVYEQVKALFESSSPLMRRIKRGACRGEYGHPKPIGMRPEEFAGRVLSIWEERVSHHIKEVWLDFEGKDEQGRNIVRIMGKILPNGPFGHILERQLENKDENVCFSIRSFTDDGFRNGRMERVLKTIVTWDYVNEPGISAAEKYKSPTLESFDEILTRGQLERGLELYRGAPGVAMESTISAEELFQSMGWGVTPDVGPKPAAWAGW